MQRIGFIVLPGFQMLSVSSLSVFELANWEIGEPAYHVHLLSETGGSIRSSVGISVATEPFDNRNFDTLMVGGSAVAGALDARRDQVSAPGFAAIAAGSLDVHWRVRAGRSRSTGRPSCDDALAPRARIAGSVSKGEGGGR